MEPFYVVDGVEYFWPVYSMDENTPLKVVPSERPVVKKNRLRNSIIRCKCDYVRNDQFDICPACGCEYIVGYQVTEQAQALIDDAELVKKQVWFHATKKKNWEPNLKEAGVTVHLGTEESALDIIKMRHRKGYSRKFFLYAVTIPEEATISSNTCPDLVTSWQKTSDALLEKTNSDFVRYINSYEGAGDMSLIGNPRKMSVVGMTTHTMPKRSLFHRLTGNYFS